MTGVARRQTYHRQVERLRDRRDRLAVRRLDIVLVFTGLALLVATAAFLTDHSLSFALIDRSADLAINSVTVLAAGSLAALALARYRESGRLAGLYQASAFLLIAWIALLNVAVVVLKVDAQLRAVVGKPAARSEAAAAVHCVDLASHRGSLARRRRTCSGEPGASSATHPPDAADAGGRHQHRRRASCTSSASGCRPSTSCFRLHRRRPASSQMIQAATLLRRADGYECASRS